MTWYFFFTLCSHQIVGKRKKKKQRLYIKIAENTGEPEVGSNECRSGKTHLQRNSLFVFYLFLIVENIMNKLPTAYLQWYFTKDDLLDTPTICHGRTFEDEQLDRIKGCHFLLAVGAKLGL